MATFTLPKNSRINEGKVFTYIGSDNFRAGELDGEYLVRRLGGTLSVASELNKGSTFTVTLPINWNASVRNQA